MRNANGDGERHKNVSFSSVCMVQLAGTVHEMSWSDQVTVWPPAMAADWAEVGEGVSAVELEDEGEDVEGDELDEGEEVVGEEEYGELASSELPGWLYR